MTTELLDAIESKDYDRAGRAAQAQPATAVVRDDSGMLPAVLALYAGREDLARALLPSDEHLTIFEAALFGRVQAVLARLDADPTLLAQRSPDGFTALHLAVFAGDERIAALLIERGADVEAAATGATAPEVRPLHTAVFARAPRLATLLLEAGADPDSREAGGLTPLHGAAENDDAEMTRLLLDRGADPALPDDRGRRPADLTPPGEVLDLLRSAGSRQE
jgi:ankyrin repeat protein